MRKKKFRVFYLKVKSNKIAFSLNQRLLCRPKPPRKVEFPKTTLVFFVFSSIARWLIPFTGDTIQRITPFIRPQDPISTPFCCEAFLRTIHVVRLSFIPIEPRHRHAFLAQSPDELFVLEMAVDPEWNVTRVGTLGFSWKGLWY